MSHGMTRAQRLQEMERLYLMRAYSDIEMADRLGVDRTTIYRDRIELEGRIPIYQDEEGRYRVNRSTYISDLRLNLAEALSLYLAARRASQQTRLAHQHVASAIEKLSVTMRQPMTERLVRAADVILAQRHDATRNAIFSTVATAWAESRRIRLEYRALRDGRTRAHRFEPYLLEPSPWSDGVYLIGHSDLVQRVLTLKLDRIVKADLLGPFELPAGFDEQSLLRHAWGIWGSEHAPETVVLRFAPGQTARRVKESVWHPLEKVSDTEDGGCLWEAPIAEWQEMLPWIRGWGAQVEVLEPQELREVMMGEARRMASLYLITEAVNGILDSSPRFLAHTANAQGLRQDLLEHLKGVATLAKTFAEAFEAGDLAHTVGMWHDLGKFHPHFQEYLREAERSGKRPAKTVDHKAAGCLQAIQSQQDALVLVIQAHHGGLQNVPLSKSWFHPLKEDGADALEVARQHYPDLLSIACPDLPSYVQRQPRSAEFFLRMLFSTLVDADFLDTEAHFAPERAEMRRVGVSLATLWDRFQADQSALLGDAPTTPVNTLRKEVYDACLHAAAGARGFYRMTVPTGGGKTRAAMGFALRHAIEHELDRVIVAVPYISITEQTAQVYRDILVDVSDAFPAVLEHHSGSVENRKDADDYDPQRVVSRLASENWDAPIVVTTTVQLFESLFANATSRCRKLHRLAGSVIILDEVQALPVHLLDPILDAIRELCSHYNATVVLSTATQPAFDTLPLLQDIVATEIVPNPVRLFRALKRVEYDWQLNAALSWDEVAGLMNETDQVLTVLNTKKDALALLDALDDPNALHLSTLLCGAHRRAVLQEVRRRLQAGESCHLVSTQVVEAGVDLDFPLVLRALAPLSSIIQAAGRANREGKLDLGRVVVFEPVDGGMPPGTYKRSSQTTQALVRHGTPDMDDPATVHRFFRAVYQIEQTDAEDIQMSRAKLDYPNTAENFRMIPGDTIDVVVPYGTAQEQAEVQQQLAALRSNPAFARSILRRLQPYLVTLFTRQATAYSQQGLITEVLPGVGEWHGRYDEVRGLVAEGFIVDRFVV